MSGLGLGWSLKSLMRRRLRTALSVAGIAISAAMLLDMVMLSGGIEKSFAEMLLARGYQILHSFPTRRSSDLDRKSVV